MRHIFASLRDKSASGGWLEGTDRLGFPILACDSADAPEQSLHACTRTGTECPKCYTSKDELGNNATGPSRTAAETLSHIQEALKLDSSDDIESYLKEHGLSMVLQPFWEHWAHTDIHESITPDILHQLYQGMVKHLIEWCKALIGTKELDERFKRMPQAHNLRHFKDGISILQRVSGNEHKAITRQLLGCIAGKIAPDAIRATRALLDFLYVAQYDCHSDETLAQLQQHLDDFHKYKDVFIRLDIRAGA